VAVVTNFGLDHHAEFGAEEEVVRLFDEWLAQVPDVVRGWELEPVDIDLIVPGEHNRLNAAAALTALELAGVPRAEGASALARFEGVGRRFELVGEAGGVAVYDDYAHNPAKVAAAIATARGRTEGRVLVLFQPHLYSRTRHVAAELGRELAAADVVAVAEVYPAREQPLDGVSGKLVVDALVAARPGFVPGWTPSLEDAARFVVRRARPGDLVLTVGAGDVDRAAWQVLEQLRSR
jgi:UDP-N-acetylmuramate--alanine ligase